MNIDEMTPEELNKAVAEAMGYEVSWFSTHRGVQRDSEGKILYTTESMEQDDKGDCPVLYMSNNPLHWVPISDWSGFVHKAWMLVVDVSEASPGSVNRYAFAIQSEHGSRNWIATITDWEATYRHNGRMPEWIGEGETAPLAIVRAWLKWKSA